uniref:DUF641 domain-containing protein n=1 Tax=Panagrellus redivivus TaxID=6233 RepID=A0A7E5A1J3_PANRE
MVGDNYGALASEGSRTFADAVATFVIDENGAILRSIVKAPRRDQGDPFAGHTAKLAAVCPTDRESESTQSPNRWLPPISLLVGASSEETLTILQLHCAVIITMKAMWIFLFILAVVALTDATDGCDDRLASCQMYNAQLEVSNAKLKAENAELLRQLDASMNANRQSRLIPAKKEPNESEIQTDADLVVDLWVALCSPAYRIPTMPRNSSHEFMELLTNFETLFETYHRRAVQIDSQTSALSQVVADMLITPKAARGLSVNTNAEGEKIEDIVSEAPETNVKISINNLKSYLRKDDDIFDRVEKRLHDVQLDISKFARLQSLYVEPNSATVNLVESLLFSRLLGAIHYAFSKRQKVYEIYRRVFNGAQPVPVADGDQPVPVEAGDQPVPVEAGDQPMSVENV